MKRVMKSIVLAGAMAIVLAPMQARADGWVVPWVGSAFGSSIDNGRGTFGVSAGGMGGGVVGGEVDFGYNPSFFGNKTDFGNNSVNNANFFRPAASDNMFGWDAGAGVMGFFNDHVGLRGEIRYLRGTHDMNSSTGINSIDFNGNKLHFWRPSIGVVFR